MTEQKHPLPVHRLRIKKLRSLLAIIENSIRSENYYFRNLYADENGKEFDILEDGGNSCAAFVSWTLLVVELIKHPHATVFSTVKDLLASGWHEIQELKPGAVLVWEPKVGAMLEDEKIPKEHIGFCINETEAISNDSKGTGFPWKHHVTYNDTRKIDKIYWHSELDNG